MTCGRVMENKELTNVGLIIGSRLFVTTWDEKFVMQLSQSPTWGLTLTGALFLLYLLLGVIPGVNGTD